MEWPEIIDTSKKSPPPPWFFLHHTNGVIGIVREVAFSGLGNKRDCPHSGMVGKKVSGTLCLILHGKAIDMRGRKTFLPVEEHEPADVHKNW